MTHNNQKALEFFGTAGFEFWQTGGGCTAFGRSINETGEAYVMVTDAIDEGFAPTDETTRLLVGFYDEDENFDGDYAEVTSWQDAVDAANALIEKQMKTRFEKRLAEVCQRESKYSE